MMQKKILFVLLSIVFVYTLVGLGIPSVIFLGDNPTMIEITNFAETTHRFDIDVVGWIFDEKGEIKFLEKWTLPNSLDIRCFPNSFELGPREKQQLRIFCEGEVEETKWAMLFIKETPVSSTKNQIKVAIAYAIQVFKLVSGSEKEGRVTRVDKIENTVIVEFQNTGEQPMWTEGELKLIDVSGESTIIGKIEPFPSLPGGTRTISIDVKIDISAPYLILAVFDFDGDYLVAGQRVCH